MVCNTILATQRNEDNVFALIHFITLFQLQTQGGTAAGDLLP